MIENLKRTKKNHQQKPSLPPHSVLFPKDNLHDQFLVYTSEGLLPKHTHPPIIFSFYVLYSHIVQFFFFFI